MPKLLIYNAKTSFSFTLLLLILMVGTQAQAAEHPDFTGTWDTYSGEKPGGYSATPAQPKLKPEAIKARNDFLSVTEGTNYGSGNACVGYGMPSSMLDSGPYPMEIIQLPEQLLVIYEAHSEMRRFYIDDEAGDPASYFPERNGYSSTHWEGEHLIVETTRLKTQVDSRYPHSHDATIREEYYYDTPMEDGSKVLVAEMVMTDPLWLEEPFVSTKRWQEMFDYHVRTYECTEPLWLDEMDVLYDAAGLEMVQE